jgi:hypothetical protein
MTEPQSPDFGQPTDISVDAEEVEQHAAEQEESPTSSASGFEGGDADGGTGGLDAGGAG